MNTEIRAIIEKLYLMYDSIPEIYIDYNRQDKEWLLEISIPGNYISYTDIERLTNDYEYPYSIAVKRVFIPFSDTNRDVFQYKMVIRIKIPDGGERDA